MHFSKIIFSNGYTLELESAPVQAATATVHAEVTQETTFCLIMARSLTWSCKLR